MNIPISITMPSGSPLGFDIPFTPGLPIALVGGLSQQMEISSSLDSRAKRFLSPGERDIKLCSFGTSYDMYPMGRRKGLRGKILAGAAIISASQRVTAEICASQPQKQIRELNAHFRNIDVLLSSEGVLLVLVQPSEVPDLVSAFCKNDQLVLPSGIIYTDETSSRPGRSPRMPKIGADEFHAVCIARTRSALFLGNSKSS